ncbi:hypothetical protein AA0113_g3269 [Alternaria arborescens]|uniref:Uncharacterized protein n=1 Tax=Alternaria arborescens TaxID=156630 RepID=A0A4Q4SJP3_9PLEO|nr:hypothetical protein AA0111_g2128 [Alternaria arborescens]RYN19806.1 hypothetical protein AA0112_g11006 [Alternaria arborescens]RYO37524.1 hypothetical protein AA0111_g2128 [Alternaria arborescens]RYO70412.1 hypothetical protein AA0113_g3269 [Alternaria arborescens]
MSISHTTELMHETDTLSSYTDLINTKNSPPRPMYSEAAPGTHSSSKVHTTEADKATAASKDDRTPEPEKASQTGASNVTR